MKQFRIRQGWRYPPGATVDPDGTNFSVFSRHATSAELLLYERSDSSAPFQVIELDPDWHRTFFTWHVYVEGLPPGVHYTWRVDGPQDTRHTGFRFNKDVELLDPWARGVTDTLWNRRGQRIQSGLIGQSMRAVVVDDTYDWEDDCPVNHPMERSIIYELHVGGFTRHPSAQVSHPGTFAAIIDKIPYLKDLGVTDVELMPVMAFDEQDVPDRAFRLGLKNYWGYSTHSFFCPHPGYCRSPEKGTHVNEFRDMVKAFHKAGMGVILDVVFNHTAEGGDDGPTISFKGLSNEIAYHLDPNDRRLYLDFTGCGNTLNCNHPAVARLIVSCLEYWVSEMHVDGFRFDLASVMARGEDGQPLSSPPVLWNIEFSDDLVYTKIIAEAWDAAGLYQVGAFPGFRWAEWNGRYRDVVRRFVRGDKGLVAEVATRMSGSSDLYQADGRLPINSINFVTCHDGFTLYDLVSYNEKHNEANVEQNRDGVSENLSWNCGEEGEADSLDILALRRRQAKNFIAILLLSQGVPMLLAGDEVLRTQKGNNNAYCQDNEISWFDWTLTEANADMLDFIKGMIAFRKRHPCLMRNRFLTGKNGVIVDRDGKESSESGKGGRQSGKRSHLPDVTWHGVKLDEPLWHDPDAQVLAFTLAAAAEEEENIHVMLNMSETSHIMQLPKVEGSTWYRALDTAEARPGDICRPADQPAVHRTAYHVRPRSVVALESRPCGVP